MERYGINTSMHLAERAMEKKKVLNFPRIVSREAIFGISCIIGFLEFQRETENSHGLTGSTVISFHRYGYGCEF